MSSDFVSDTEDRRRDDADDEENFRVEKDNGNDYVLTHSLLPKPRFLIGGASRRARAEGRRAGSIVSSWLSNAVASRPAAVTAPSSIRACSTFCTGAEAQKHRSNRPAPEFNERSRVSMAGGAPGGKT